MGDELTGGRPVVESPPARDPHAGAAPGSGKRYGSVTEMVRDLSDDPSFVAEFEAKLREGSVAAPDEVTRERDACLAACRRVLVGGPIPHSLVAAYEEIRGIVESGQHREATP